MLGSGDGQFTDPEGIAVDGSGNVFVADGNLRIEKFACPIPPAPPACGVINGDPGAGTATCGGPCPLDFPFCAWVPGTVTGSCRCVDTPPCGSVVGVACSGSFCGSQNETCVTGGIASTCQCQ
jgi:hypothetical protein